MATMMEANIADNTVDRGNVKSTRTGMELTDREREVLLQICTGKCSKAIGDDLRIAPSTVKRHIQNTYRKLGVNNRFQAILWASKYL